MSNKTSPTIHLLYTPDCPNVELARRNLRSAMKQRGLEPSWEEIALDARTVRDDWKGFPSPTVLVEGRDVVTQARSASGSSACRLGGAPSAKAIASALMHRIFGREPGSKSKMVLKYTV